MITFMIYLGLSILVAALFAWPPVKAWLLRKHSITLKFAGLFNIKTFCLQKKIGKIDLQSFGLTLKGVYFEHIQGLSFKLVIKSVKVSLHVPTIELELFDNYEDSQESFLKILQNVLKIKGSIKRIL